MKLGNKLLLALGLVLLLFYMERGVFGNFAYAGITFSSCQGSGCKDVYVPGQQKFKVEAKVEVAKKPKKIKKSKKRKKISKVKKLEKMEEADRTPAAAAPLPELTTIIAGIPTLNVELTGVGAGRVMACTEGMGITEGESHRDFPMHPPDFNDYFEGFMAHAEDNCNSPAQREVVSKQAIQILENALLELAVPDLVTATVVDDVKGAPTGDEDKIVDLWEKVLRVVARKSNYFLTDSTLRDVLGSVRDSVRQGIIPVPSFLREKAGGNDHFSLKSLEKYFFRGIAPVSVSVTSPAALSARSEHPLNPLFLLDSFRLMKHDIEHADLMATIFRDLNLKYRPSCQALQECLRAIGRPENRLTLFYLLHEDLAPLIYKNVFAVLPLAMVEFSLERVMNRKKIDRSWKAFLGVPPAKELCEGIQEKINNFTREFSMDHLFAREHAKDEKVQAAVLRETDFLDPLIGPIEANRIFGITHEKGKIRLPEGQFLTQMRAGLLTFFYFKCTRNRIVGGVGGVGRGLIDHSSSKALALKTHFQEVSQRTNEKGEGFYEDLLRELDGRYENIRQIAREMKEIPACREFGLSFSEREWPHP